ncbi:MAG: chorismate-binding protein [Bacteriovoracaceae bacterium]
MNKVSNILEWLDDDFYRQGAFMTEFETNRVLLGKGGVIKEVSSFETTPAFYLKYFFENKYLAYFPESFLETTLDEIKKLFEFNGNNSLISVRNDDEIYKEDFLKLKMAFNQELQKVVLISRESFELRDQLKAKKDFFAKALNFGTGLPYGIWFKEYGIIGSTPEILFSKKELQLKTFALAGTAKLGEEEQLLNSKKDRLEHDLVIQDILEKMKPFAENISRGETALLNFKKIIHLKTNIEATLKENINLVSVVNELSPTAALGGYPKESSLQFLRNSLYSKLHPKRFFGSAFGISTQSICQFVVAIRNIQWDEKSFFIESGGGILAESDLDKEMNEFKLKRETIKSWYL